MNGVEHLLGVSFRQTLGCYVKSSPMLSISKGTSTLHDASTPTCTVCAASARSSGDAAGSMEVCDNDWGWGGDDLDASVAR